MKQLGAELCRSEGTCEELGALAREAFGEHPFAESMDRAALEAMLPDYLGMSLAFRYLQAAAQKEAVFDAIQENRAVSEELEMMNAVANFLSFDESGGADLLLDEGKRSLPKLLETDRFHSNMLRADAQKLLGHPIEPHFGPETRRYLHALHRGLAATDLVVRCAHMVAFELHAGEMIAALWKTVTACTDVPASELAYFKRHVGGDDPAEEYHVQLTQRLIGHVVRPAQRERFRREFLTAYELHVAWCEALTKRPSKLYRYEPRETWHAGSCHCKGVRFEVSAPSDLDVVRCSCSICDMTGFLHLMVPAESFRLLAGEELLSSYRFNQHIANHTFCKHCGTKPFYRPRSNPDGFSVNVRCLDRSTVSSLNVQEFDGQHWEESIGSLSEARAPRRSGSTGS